MEGITYKEDCLVGAKNFLERFLCGDSSYITRIYWLVFVLVSMVLVFVLILGIYLLIKRLVLKKRK